MLHMELIQACYGEEPFSKNWMGMNHCVPYLGSIWNSMSSICGKLRGECRWRTQLTWRKLKTSTHALVPRYNILFKSALKAVMGKTKERAVAYIQQDRLRIIHHQWRQHSVCCSLFCCSCYSCPTRPF